jgi:streptogramin lyase
VSPSRTAVDFNGDVWIANRAFDQQGTVTKIQAEGCTGADCVLFTVNVGGVNQLPRALAIDREGFAWVGTFSDGILYRLAPDTGAVVEQYSTGLQIYGIAIDREGIIWIATLSESQGIGAFDTTTKRMIGNWNNTGGGYCLLPYGIAVDGEGNVWFGNWTCNGLIRLDRASFDAPGSPVRFDRYTGSGMERTRGVAVDGEGFIYVASSNTNRLARFNPSTASFDWSASTCAAPIGVGIASDGNVWTMCQSANQTQRFDPAGNLLTTLPTGDGPYSYSDMTGFQLRNFTAPRGVWRQIFECRPEPLTAECKFDEVIWSATVLPDTAVTVRARTSTDTLAWSEWTTPAGASPLNTGTLPRGRYLEVEVQLSTNQNDLTPVVSSLQVLWQRP